MIINKIFMSSLKPTMAPPKKIRQVLLLSSSKVHGYSYLEYAKQDIINLLKRNEVQKVLFIPYALRDHDNYLNTVQKTLEKWGYEVEGIHKSNPIEAAEKAEAFFVGGGNTFQLLKSLYDNKLVDVIRNRILNEGVPYIGTSAGTNVATKSIHTTNDMPIVYPPSFDALNLVPFNINPHYQDVENSVHMGETREERILQFQEIPGTGPVIGLREGCTLSINGNEIVLLGLKKARIFVPNEEPREVDVGTDLSFLMNV